MSKRKSDLTVQAQDTYDPADYITVHLDYFNGMRAALRHAHGDKCICIYCRNEQPASAPETRADAEALAAVPELKDKHALVLYFLTDADRDEFVGLVHEAKPGMRTVKL